MRRRQRKVDEFQSEAKILELVERIRFKVFGESGSFEETMKMLYAAQNVARDNKPVKSRRSGRRSYFPRQEVLTKTTQIRQVLADETKERISLARFVTAYLPVLKYPNDVKKALENDSINIEEARFLARVKKSNLPPGLTRGEKSIRKELLESHLERHGSQTELYRRVCESLRLQPNQSAMQVSAVAEEIVRNTDSLLALNEFDTEHLFWEEIKSLIYLLREVDAELIGEEELMEIFANLDNLKLKLLKYRMQDISPEVESSNASDNV